MHLTPMGLRRTILLLLLASTTAQAEWHAAAYLGGTYNHRTALTISQPGLSTSVVFRDVVYRGQSFEGPLYYGLRGGYFFGSTFGVEGEFIHQKVFADVNRTVQVDGVVRGVPVSGRMPMNTLVQRFSISHGVNLLLANLTLRRNLLRSPGERLGRILLVSRLGAGTTIPHPENEVLGDTYESYERGRPAFQTASSVEVRVWQRAYLLAEYKFTATRQKVKVFSGTSDTLLATHHGIFGLAFHF